MTEEPEQQAAYVPPLPVSGQAIASDWGVNTHKAAFYRRGIITLGPVINNPSSDVTVPLNTVVGGNPAYLYQNTIYIPPADGGLWLVMAHFEVITPSASGWAIDCKNAEGIIFRSGGMNSPSGAGLQVYGSEVLRIVRAESYPFWFSWVGSPAASVEFKRLSVIRIAADFEG